MFRHPFPHRDISVIFLSVAFTDMIGETQGPNREAAIQEPGSGIHISSPKFRDIRPKNDVVRQQKRQTPSYIDIAVILLELTE